MLFLQMLKDQEMINVVFFKNCGSVIIKEADM